MIRAIIPRDVLIDIMDFAGEAYPKEFISLLEGKSEGEKITLTSLIYQPFVSSSYSASSRFNVPIGLNIIGTVHSHPSGNNSPSGTDLTLFGRQGLIHFIISFPYREQNLACFDNDGKPIEFEIKG
jgi:proteasome lid subunit RPN8/RPN11